MSDSSNTTTTTPPPKIPAIGRQEKVLHPFLSKVKMTVQSTTGGSASLPSWEDHGGAGVGLVRGCQAGQGLDYSPPDVPSNLSVSL